MRALKLPNPTAEASVRFSAADDSPELSLGLMLDLTELVMLPWRKRAADSSLKAAQARVAGDLMDIVLDAKRGLIEVQATGEQVALQGSVVQTAGAALTLAEALREAGNIPELSLSMERARYDEARLELARSEALAESARERFNQRLGLWGHTTHWTATPLAAPDEAPLNAAELEQRALRASLDLELAETNYAAAAGRANLAQARGVLPELRAGVEVERQDEWSVGPAIELELPLFYQGQAEVALAEAQMRQERSRHSALAVRVRSAVRAAFRKLSVARDLALHYRDRLLPERERIVKQTELMYNAMSVGAFALLQARRDQVQASAAYLDALRDYWVARAELDHLLAGRLVDVAPLSQPQMGASAEPGGH